MGYLHAATHAAIRVLRHIPSVRGQSKIGHFRVTAVRLPRATLTRRWPQR
jgi:hypothetical protein